MTHIIRIDAISQGNFQMRFVGQAATSTSFKVAPGDSIRFVAYRNNRKIDYQIVFKSPQRSPFTDVDRIDMPHGGLTDALAVTTVLAGGMPFSIMIPSLGWHVDPEILVEGATTTDEFLRQLLEQLEHTLRFHARTPTPHIEHRIKVQVNANAFTFTPSTDPLVVHPGETIAWELTQNGVDVPNFAINFSAASGPQSPLENLENGLGPDYYDGKAAIVSDRLFRKLQASEGQSKDFNYVIAMQTVDPHGNMPASQPRTITLSNV